MAEEGSFECGECGEEFDTKRGRSIHQAQMHDGEEQEEAESTGQQTSPETDAMSDKTSDKDTFDFSINKTHGLVFMLLFGLIIGYGAGNVFPMTQPGTAAADPGTDQTDSGNSEPSVAKIDNSGDPMLGSEDAEITMVLYEDFQCPFCARFENNAFPQIKENYVDTGKVKVVWKDFPLQRIHPWATDAAETMECVYRQDEEAFWNVKNTIYDNLDSIDQSNVRDRIIQWASQEGVDSSNVRGCLENGNPREEVQQDLREGQSFEATVQGDQFVAGTPSVVIYSEGDDTGEPLVGAQPYSRFKSVIDSERSG